MLFANPNENRDSRRRSLLVLAGGMQYHRGIAGRLANEVPERVTRSPFHGCRVSRILLNRQSSAPTRAVNDAQRLAGLVVEDFLTLSLPP